METKILKPWQFLALVFNHLRRNSESSIISFKELNLYADYLNSVYDVTVDWDHDNYNFCFGFYSPVFQKHDNRYGNADGVSCNYGKLRIHYKDIISNGCYVPKKREIKFVESKIYPNKENK